MQPGELAGRIVITVVAACIVCLVIGGTIKLLSMMF